MNQFASNASFINFNNLNTKFRVFKLRFLRYCDHEKAEHAR